MLDLSYLLPWRHQVWKKQHHFKRKRTCDWSRHVSSHLLLYLLVPKLPTAPLSTCSLVTSSWRQATASLTTCQTTWSYGSWKNSRCRLKHANIFTPCQTCNSFGVCSFQAPSYDSVLQTAQSIAQQAHDLAYDPNYMSPFAQFACDNGLNVRGTYTDPAFNSIFFIFYFFITHWFCPTCTFSRVFLTCRREARRHHSAVVHCGWIYRLNMCSSVVGVCIHASEAGPSIPSAWVFHLQPSR